VKPFAIRGAEMVAIGAGTHATLRVIRGAIAQIEDDGSESAFMVDCAEAGREPWQPANCVRSAVDRVHDDCDLTPPALAPAFLADDIESLAQEELDGDLVCNQVDLVLGGAPSRRRPVFGLRDRRLHSRRALCEREDQVIAFEVTQI
jgi:hypothetical protein